VRGGKREGGDSSKGKKEAHGIKRAGPSVPTKGVKKKENPS